MGTASANAFPLPASSESGTEFEGSCYHVRFGLTESAQGEYNPIR
jgi:hypothetical protein